MSSSRPFFFYVSKETRRPKWEKWDKSRKSRDKHIQEIIRPFNHETQMTKIYNTQITNKYK